jgi:APA family basic amino acid/polyamine antiporter
MAAVAVTFARYALEITGAAVSEAAVATAALTVLTIVNCLGVRAGSAVQSALMVLKIAAILTLVVCGFLLVREPRALTTPVLDRPLGLDLATSIGAALVPVLFAYGGWQTSGFVSAELKDARRDMPRALLLGVSGVVALYLAVNVVCLRTLGADGLAATRTPASELMRRVLGEPGARLIALGIAVSTLGFLSQGILTAPRVYYAMARDGVFFARVGWLHPTTRVPVVAIVLQGIAAAVIALSGRYEQILSYVVFVDFMGFGLTGASLFVFRRRGEQASGFRVPGHPYTTAFFAIACGLVVANTFFRFPANSAIGLAILLTGIPVYSLWRRQAA